MGVIGAIVAGIASWLGAGAAAASAIGTAVNLGLAAFSIASSMGAAKEQRQAAERARLDSINRNAFRNFRQPLTPRRIIFGRCRVAGPLIFAHNRKRHGTHLIVALSGHEVAEIESVWILQDELPFLRTGTHAGRVSGKYGKAVIVKVFRGTATQDIGAAMLSATDVRSGVPAADLALDDIIDTTDKFHGIAAIYAICRGWSQFFEGETPEFGAIVKGNNQIYDPRDESTGYTANPALCAAWYLTAIMGFPWESLDADALALAADVCDQDVTLKAGGTEKRYECHGVITADMQHREVLDLLGRSMAGMVRYSSGKWIIQAGAAPEEEPIDFSEDHAQAGYRVLYDPPDRSLPNAVRGSNVDPTTWQPRAYPQRPLPAAVAVEGGPWWLDIDLPLTLSATMAQRIARIELLRARARRRFSVDLDLRGLKAKPGSIVTWAAPDIGMEAATFEVDAFSFARRDGKNGPVLGTHLDLVEWSADIYAWNPATDELDGDLGISDPGGFEPIAPEGCYTETGLVAEDDHFTADYEFHWEDPDIEEASLSFIRAAVLVTIIWDNAGSPEVTTHTATDDIDPEIETATLNVPATQAGWTYVSHSVEATLAAYYSSGMNSGPAPLGTCPVPPLTGHASAGSFPTMTFQLESTVGTINTYRGSVLAYVLIHDTGSGNASVENEVTSASIALRASIDYLSPTGSFAAYSDAQDDFNAGNPWNYVIS